MPSKKEDKLSSLIKREYQQKHNRAQAFLVICQELGYDISLDGNISQCFNDLTVNDLRPIKFDSNDLNKLEPKYLELYKSIDSKYSVWDKSIYYSSPLYDKWSEHKQFVFMPSNPRYALKFEHSYTCFVEDAESEDDYEKNYLVLMDYFHGKERFLPIKGLKFGRFNDNEFQLHWISFDRVVLHEIDSEPVLYLVSIDFKTFECELLHCEELEFPIESLVFDRENPRRFGIISESDNDIFCVQLNEIGEDDKIRIGDEEENIYIDSYPNYTCLRNDKLCGLDRFVRNEEELEIHNTFYYSEAKLDKTDEIQELVKKFDFQSQLEFVDGDLSDFDIYQCSWSTNKCYFNLFDTQLKSYIVCLDLEKQNCSLIQSIHQQSVSFGLDTRFHDNLQTENDEVLSFQFDGSVCRVPLTKPESLKNICWFKIHHNSTFYESQLYDKALKFLPTNDEFQPFSMRF